jgi:pimeloyl-[acyl-carrier protein] methyl ester esterase
MTTLVLLPGMDGTGALFDFLLPHLSSDFAPKVISYPTDTALSYEKLAELVFAQLPAEPFALLGESFSGPVALAVAQRCAPVALVLVCTFATNPRPALAAVKPLLRWLPSPSKLLGPLSVALMGREETPALRSALSRSLQSVAPAVLRHRAACALSASAEIHLANVRCPVLYLQASRDRIVPPSCARAVKRILPSTQVVRLEAPHFLLQTKPAAAARAIEDFLRRLENAA